VREVIRIAEEAHTAGIVSHVKALGKDSWGLGPTLIKDIDDARARGVQVYADQYPYEASSTSLRAALRRSRGPAFLANRDGRERPQGHTLTGVDPGEHFSTRGARRQTFELGQQVVGERLPGPSARILSLRCSGSGMFRIWTIRDMSQTCVHASRMSNDRAASPTLAFSSSGKWPNCEVGAAV
jgi:hypothetical protein